SRSPVPMPDVPCVRCQAPTASTTSASTTRVAAPVAQVAGRDAGACRGTPVTGVDCVTVIGSLREDVDVGVDDLLGGARTAERPDALGEGVHAVLADAGQVRPDVVLGQFGGPVAVLVLGAGVEQGRVADVGHAFDVGLAQAV